MKQNNRVNATPELLARLDEALTRTRGNRRHAGDMLGLTFENINYMVRSTPGLKAKWGVPEDPPEVDTLSQELDRPSPMEELRKERQATADALTRQDAIVEKSKAELPGFSARDRRFFSSIIAAYANDLKSTLDFSYAGAVHANAKLVLTLEKLCNRLARIESHPEEFVRTSVGRDGTENETKGPGEYLKETVSMIVSVSSELRKLSTTVAQAQEIRLKVERLRAASDKAVVSLASWKPAVNVTPTAQEETP